jgi:lipopolysaccharide/colanic/teichoic acid biosynthesis glycosyltransferase
VGKFLRKTSLDEVPQIVNVLRGEMSLVGPRPTSFAASTYRLWHAERLEVTPGITGLWQVRGRNESTFDERLRLDVEYIARRSILFDLRIMLETVGSVVNRSGE